MQQITLSAWKVLNIQDIDNDRRTAKLVPVEAEFRQSRQAPQLRRNIT